MREGSSWKSSSPCQLTRRIAVRGLASTCKVAKTAIWKSLGILDTEFVVSNALSGATEAAIGVLRIDDVLWARTDPSTPDWESSED